MALQLRFLSHSETGPVRKNNQDSGFASPQLLVVADGMGGAAAGDLASAVAIDTIRGLADDPTALSHTEQADDDADPDQTTETPETNGVSAPMLESLAQVINRANDRIADLIRDDYNLEGMGTTVTGALFDGAQLGLAHIGDSRAYLLRDGHLQRLTHDHSWVQSLVDDGKITEAEAAIHPHRSLLLKVLNGQHANDPDLTLVTVRPGDRLLFCSDGVCGLVDDPEIEAALRIRDLQQALLQLVSEALAGGGIDNITAIVADVVDGAGAGTTAVLGAASERDIPEIREQPAPGVDQLTDTLERPEVTAAALVEPEDEARYNPRAPRRFRFLRPVLGLLVVVLVLGSALGAGYAWTRTQYFVGASAGQVTIFQGLPEGLPGISLATVFEIQPLPVASLPTYYQEQVAAGIEATSLEGARQTVQELSDAARRCGTTASPSPTPRATTSVTASPSTSATIGPSVAPTVSAAASPSASVRPTASPTPGAGCR